MITSPVRSSLYPIPRMLAAVVVRKRQPSDPVIGGPATGLVDKWTVRFHNDGVRDDVLAITARLLRRSGLD
jgi:hypothetical protein